MLDLYQNLPQFINPIAFSIGFLNVRWYSLMYLVGLFVVLGLLHWRLIHKETSLKREDVFDFVLYSFLFALLGGRIGYVFLYNLPHYLQNPTEIFLPFDESGKFIGLFGMSFYGALVGLLTGGFIFCKKRKIDMREMIDFIVPAVPAGYFFGRVGNFLNGELYGRVTDVWWGMFFNGEEYLRHPSQLYEALFEGLLLFFLLWLLRNKFSDKKGFLGGLYIVCYGLIRFILEFFREPDEQLGFVFGWLTMGQLLSLLAVLIGFVYVKLSLKFKTGII